MRRLAACVLLAATACTVAAQSYPVKPVKLISPFAPGGGTDFIARLLAQQLSSALGQQFIVENKPAAGGSAGVEYGVKSAPDGYTLTLISNSYTANPAVHKVRFDPVAAITPVIQIAQGPLIVAVHPSLPVNNLADLVQMAKANPQAIYFATTGLGSVNHLAIERFADMAGFKLNYVPYKGTGPALIDTIAGQTNALFGASASTLAHVKAGRLKALAVTTKSRLAAEPDLPTVDESAVPGYEMVLWYGLIAPRGLQPPIRDRLNSEVAKILKRADIVEQLQTDGLLVVGGSPDQLLKRIQGEIKLWAAVAHRAGIKVIE